MSTQKNHRAGTHGTLAGLEIGKKLKASEFPEAEKFLGCEVEGARGFRYRLVKLKRNAAEAFEAKGLAFAYVALATNAKRTFEVNLAIRGGTKPLHRAVGFAVEDQDPLDDGDLFWLVVDGPEIQGITGDDATAIAIGDYVGLDDDVDGGKLYGTGTTFSAENTVGVSLTTVAGSTEDLPIKIVPIRKFRT